MPWKKIKFFLLLLFFNLLSNLTPLTRSDDSQLRQRKRYKMGILVCFGLPEIEMFGHLERQRPVLFERLVLSPGLGGLEGGLQS